MANPRWKIEVSVEDGEGKIATQTFYHNSAVYADAQSAAVQMGNLVGALTEGVVRRVTLTETVATSAAAPDQHSDVEIKALFTFMNNDGKAYQTSIPAFDRNNMLPNSDQVDMTQANVTGFTDAIISAGYVDSRAIDIVALKSALEQFTRRRNR